MYHVINSHIRQVLNAIRTYEDVRPYIWLKEKFPIVNVEVDADFQTKFRQYWRPRVSNEFLDSYFSLLEKLKDRDDVKIKTVVFELYKIPTHSNEKQTVQFSLASKFVHTLRPHSPVYDSTVDAFYFFPPGPQNEKAKDKIQRLLLAYQFLVQEYGRILNRGLLSQAISEFRERFDPDSVFTDEKVIDTLIWRFVTLLQKGGLRDGRVSYD